MSEQRWYIVKQNWHATRHRMARYAGVGGDVWLLDAVHSPSAHAMHQAYLNSMKHIDLGGHEEFLCTDISVAEAYFVEAHKHACDVWLLSLAIAHPGEAGMLGLDIGHAAGGYSLLETELLAQGRVGPKLNNWGLLEGFQNALDYLSTRALVPELEDAEGLVVLALWNARHKGQVTSEAVPMRES